MVVSLLFRFALTFLLALARDAAALHRRNRLIPMRTARKAACIKDKCCDGYACMHMLSSIVIPNYLLCFKSSTSRDTLSVSLIGNIE